MSFNSELLNFQYPLPVCILFINKFKEMFTMEWSVLYPGIICTDSNNDIISFEIRKQKSSLAILEGFGWRQVKHFSSGFNSLQGSMKSKLILSWLALYS